MRYSPGHPRSPSSPPASAARSAASARAASSATLAEARIPSTRTLPSEPTQSPQWNTHSVPLASANTLTRSQNHESPKTPSFAHASLTPRISPSSVARLATNVSTAPEEKYCSLCSPKSNAQGESRPSASIAIETFASVPEPIRDPVTTSTRYLNAAAAAFAESGGFFAGVSVRSSPPGASAEIQSSHANVATSPVASFLTSSVARCHAGEDPLPSCRTATPTTAPTSTPSTRNSSAAPRRNGSPRSSGKRDHPVVTPPAPVISTETVASVPASSRSDVRVVTVYVTVSRRALCPPLAGSSSSVV